MAKFTLVLCLLSFCLSIINARYRTRFDLCTTIQPSNNYRMERIWKQICNPDIEYSWCGIVDKAMPTMCSVFNEPTTSMMKRTYTDDILQRLEDLSETSKSYDNFLDQQEVTLDVLSLKPKRGESMPNTLLFDCCTFNCSASFIWKYYCGY